MCGSARTVRQRTDKNAIAWDSDRRRLRALAHITPLPVAMRRQAAARSGSGAAAAATADGSVGAPSAPISSTSRAASFSASSAPAGTAPFAHRLSLGCGIPLRRAISAWLKPRDRRRSMMSEVVSTPAIYAISHSDAMQSRGHDCSTLLRMLLHRRLTPRNVHGEPAPSGLFSALANKYAKAH